MLPARVGSEPWDSVALGTFHSCGLRSGELWCWGRNEGGQLGQNTVTDAEAEGEVWLGAHSDWLSVDVGRFHTCGLRNDDAVEAPSAWCVGNNSQGQLGVGDRANRLVPLPVLADE